MEFYCQTGPKWKSEFSFMFNATGQHDVEPNSIRCSGYCDELLRTASPKVFISDSVIREESFATSSLPAVCCLTAP